MLLLLWMSLWGLALAQEYVGYYPGHEEVEYVIDDGNYGSCEEEHGHLTNLGDELCIKELGCFKLTADYYHPQYRPCNVLPEPRSLIYTRFVLFTRSNVHKGKFIDADNETSIKESGFNANHSTVVIVHGYQENPLHDAWVLILMKELLNANNTNVVVVDWSKGSDHPYIQAVANARIAGAEIARMTNALKKYGNLTTNMMHIIGHGLGAHVAGYAGASILPRVARITGLDPAYKYFCNMPDTVRLDPMDANFVDVIHTEPKSYDSGHGGCHKLGHVDFFPVDPSADHGPYDVEEHRQAVAMFISTIRNSSCRMIGYYCRNHKAFLRGECGDCGSDGSRCAPLGYRADRYLPFRNSNFSSMYLVTGEFPNFCVFEYRIRMLLQNRDTGLENHPKSGNLLVLLRGEHKPLFVHLKFYSMNDGQEYTFLVTSGINIGEVKNVTIRWEEQGTYDERWLSGQTVWYYQNSNVNVQKINVTLLNFDFFEQSRGNNETEYCEAATTNDPGWLTYLPNCV